MPARSFGHGSLRRRARRWAHSPVAPSRLGGGGAAGGPFLPDVFPGGRQSIEAAFGADLDGDPAAWPWVQIAAQWDPGGDVRIGYGGEVARPAPAAFSAKLRNDQSNGGDWTLGNTYSRWWPNLRENTPIRARLDVGSGPVDVFNGYLTGVPQHRGPAGKNFVTLNAHGYLRRLTRGQGPPFSALRKAIKKTLPEAYWPLEKGAGSTIGASAVEGVPDMIVTAGKVGFGAGDADLPASLPLATFSSEGIAGQLTGVLPPVYTTNFLGETSWRVEFVTKFGALDTGDYISMIDWNVTGTVERWNLRAEPQAEGGLQLQYTSPGGSGNFPSNVGIDDGEWHQIRVDAVQSFGDIAYSVQIDGEEVISGTFVGTNGNVTVVIVNYDLNPGVGVPTLGHLAVWQPYNSTVDTLDAFHAHTGETVAERMARLADDANVRLTVVGDAPDLMGPQRPGTFLEVLQDAIDVDRGALFDGLDPGLTYYTRLSAYSRPAALTLDASRGDFLGPLDGEHDDRDRINTYTARDPFTGGDRTHEREDGDLGTDAVGTYDDSGEYRVFDLDQLDQLAAFRTGAGTVPGLRWPTLTFQLAKPSTSRLAQRWLEARPLDRIDALGITTGSNPDRSLLLRGWRLRWNSKIFEVTANVGPYDAYAVTSLGDDAGTDDEFLGWLDVDTVVTAAELAAGGTSVTVTVTGTVLTNATTPSPSYADDIDGLYVNIDGMRVGVTAITGSASPQTLTLVGADVLRPVPIGTAVTAWDPVVLGL